MDHKITISNFNTQDTVTYSIIKLVGAIEPNVPLACRGPTNQKIELTQTGSNTISSTHLVNNKFKFLIQLELGLNQICIKHLCDTEPVEPCCDALALEIQYISNDVDYAVIPLYVICEGHDGCFQAPRWEESSAESACKRITLGSKLLQCVTAEKLYEHGLGRKTFSVSGPCQIFKSALNVLRAREMEQGTLWEVIGREILKSNMAADSENKKYMAFLSCTRYRGDKYEERMTSHDELIGITEGYVALGGGGLALFGTASLHTWPEDFEDILPRFEDTALIDRRAFLDDSCYRGTFGACFSTTLGSVLHELYHTFDLGHTEQGIMGRGFDNIRNVFAGSNFSKKSDNVEASRAFREKIEFREEFEPSSLARD